MFVTLVFLLPFVFGKPSDEDETGDEERGAGDRVGDFVAGGHVTEGKHQLVPATIAVTKAPVL